MNLLGVVSEMIWAGQLSSTSWMRAVDVAIRRAVTEVLPQHVLPWDSTAVEHMLPVGHR